MPKVNEINFDIFEKDHDVISAISDRARKEKLLKHKTISELEMDLIAVHNYDCKIDFEKLLHAAKIDFMHDICGIQLHLDRKTGKLLNHFLPRCAKWSK